MIDHRLAANRYLLGDTYTIADMSLWAWARLAPFILGDHAWDKLPNLQRFVDEIAARSAAVRAVALKDTYPFKTDMDAEARRHMFRHAATNGR